MDGAPGTKRLNHNLRVLDFRCAKFRSPRRSAVSCPETLPTVGSLLSPLPPSCFLQPCPFVFRRKPAMGGHVGRVAHARTDGQQSRSLRRNPPRDCAHLEWRLAVRVRFTNEFGIDGLTIGTRMSLSARAARPSRRAAIMRSRFLAPTACAFRRARSIPTRSISPSLRNRTWL